MITLFDFVMANKIFCRHFISQKPAGQSQQAPFSNFLSFTSYLYQHAYRTPRASIYASLTLLILLILLEDSTSILTLRISPPPAQILPALTWRVSRGRGILSSSMRVRAHGPGDKQDGASTSTGSYQSRCRTLVAAPSRMYPLWVGGGDDHAQGATSWQLLGDITYRELWRAS